MILDTFNPDFPRRTVIPRVRKIHSRCFKMQCHTVGNPFCYSRGGHSCDLVRSGTRNYEVTPDNYELLYIHDLVHDGSALVNDSLEKGRLNVWVTRRNNVKLAHANQLRLTHDVGHGAHVDRQSVSVGRISAFRMNLAGQDDPLVWREPRSTEIGSRRWST